MKIFYLVFILLFFFVSCKIAKPYKNREKIKTEIVFEKIEPCLNICFRLNTNIANISKEKFYWCDYLDGNYKIKNWFGINITKKITFKEYRYYEVNRTRDFYNGLILDDTIPIHDKKNNISKKSMYPLNNEFVYQALLYKWNEIKKTNRSIIDSNDYIKIYDHIQFYCMEPVLFDTNSYFNYSMYANVLVANNKRYKIYYKYSPHERKNKKYKIPLNGKKVIFYKWRLIDELMEYKKMDKKIRSNTLIIKGDKIIKNKPVPKRFRYEKE